MEKTIRCIFLTLCLICIIAAPAVAQKNARRRAVAPKPIAAAPAKVYLGKLDGNSYTNDFFQLKIEFPLGWLVGDNTLEAQLMGVQKSAMKTTNPKNQAAMNAALNRLTPLLGGYKALPGLPENSNLRIAVEDLKTLPQIKDGTDYLRNLKLTLKAVPLPPGFTVSEIKSETIGGLPLDYVEASYGTSARRTYALMRRGYVLLFSLESFNSEDFDALHNVLTSADLNYKK